MHTDIRLALFVLTHQSLPLFYACATAAVAIAPPTNTATRHERGMSDAQAALRGREWSPALAPYVALIGARIKERQLVIISKAFTALPLGRMASMLACSAEEAEKGACVCACVCVACTFVTRAGYSFMLSRQHFFSVGVVSRVQAGRRFCS